MIQEVKERLEETGSIYMIEFPGLTVADISELRANVIEAGGRMYVIKNRLMKLAVADTDFEPLTDALLGPNALTFCGEDPIGPLKALAEFLKERDMGVVKAGVMDGQLLSADELKRLAQIPSKLELMSQVVGAVGGPVTDFVGTLNALVSDLVFTLQAVSEKKEEEGAAA